MWQRPLPGAVLNGVEALDQAVAVLKAAEGTQWYAYLVTSIVTGTRTEEILDDVG
ncbi:hypothetical protein [Nocardiopsis sp. JB363]|uniref:hypothetical protein n=1 Tax=Nocardiopsis sp. JB363 TaxID=1434837 RepID=UPI001357E1BB|nr:hypothetical protein [Nocardiopsis sp. JB363]